MLDKEKMEGWFYIGIFAIAMLFAFISVIGLYSSISNIIITWFDYRYQPIFQAFFSLSVLAISIYLIRERIIKR